MNYTLFMDCSRNMICTYLENNKLIDYNVTFAHQIVLLDCILSNGSYTSTFNLDYNKLFFRVEYFNNLFKLEVFNRKEEVVKTLDQIMEE